MEKIAFSKKQKYNKGDGGLFLLGIRINMLKTK
jgi:hypothetical protein